MPESVESFANLLQMSVLPVVLISAVGLLLLSFTNRLGRTIDRSRAMAQKLERSPEERKSDTKEQLQILFRRSCLLRTAISFCALSILFSSLMIVGLFLLLFLHWSDFSTERFILVCLFLSVLSLIVSIVYFILDVFLTLKALTLEVGDHLGLKSRGPTEGAPAGEPLMHADRR